MIKSTLELSYELKDYANIKTKISRLIKNKKLFPLKKGLYETNSSVNPFYLSSSIYGPSYISFETALSYYNLIPERVYEITSATLNKRKKKEFSNQFGDFTYRDVPEYVYPYGTISKIEDGYSYYIAKKEKAICDMLYICPKVKTIKEIKILLFEDLRIDLELFSKLDMQLLLELATMYKTVNHAALAKLIRKEYL